MNTLWNCDCKSVSAPASRGLRASRSPRQALSSNRGRSALWVFLAVVFGLPFGGCTYSGGELLYFLGFGRKQKVEAKFRLTEGPVMILIDDISERVDWPAATRYLFDDLAQELLKHKAAFKIIPLQTVDHLRQSIPNFGERGCREVGELGGAEQVLWIEVQDFFAEEQIRDATTAAYFSVTVKAINVLEKKSRTRVRLWPTSPQGYPMTVSMSGSEVSMAKRTDAISKELAGRLAVEIAKLFYDHRLGAFERER
ncbi:MAG: hypothetical protein JSU86_13465 [Phycisphaerales bacterium]|nr:MAG: hypothetical protein JSU86_13465 [Phycisphaerales bacterium]